VLFTGSTIASSTVAIVLGMVASQHVWKPWSESWRKNDLTPRWLDAIVGGALGWTVPLLHRQRRDRAPRRVGDVLPAIQLALGAAHAEAVEREVARLGRRGLSTGQPQSARPTN
jgi:hypothetical protein